MDGMVISAAGALGRKATLLAHPALAPLIATTDCIIDDRVDAWPVLCTGSGQVIVSAAIAETADASGPCDAARLRFALELAWLRRVEPLFPASAILLAGRAAGGFLACAPPEPDEDVSELNGVFEELAGKLPSPSRSTVLLEALRATGIPVDMALEGGLASGVLAQIESLWPLAAACESLLVSGGDDRLDLDSGTKRNRYGCHATPRPGQVAFGSSTASTISPKGFAAAEALRQRLLIDAAIRSPDKAVEASATATAQAILQHFGVQDRAEALLTASGTDAALLLTLLLQAERPGTTLTSVIMSPAETGSGVPEAVRARHFSACTPSGQVVAKGAALDPTSAAPELVQIALRQDDSAARSQIEILQDCRDAIAAGSAAGHVVLHAIEGSKTGLVAPDLPGCVALAAEFGDRLDIAIDACQARLEPALVQDYLAHDFPVLITGSKFFAAPGFCGAILFPRVRLARVAADGLLAPALAGYASLDGGTPQRRCPGLLLRWSAALDAMHAFAAKPPEVAARRMDRLGLLIRTAIMRDDRLFLIAAPAPARAGWSGRRSVFTFGVRGQDGIPLDAATLRKIYLAMSAPGEGPHALRPCQIGQPVLIGTAGLAGLRMALSAPQIAGSEAAFAGLAADIATAFARLGSEIDRLGY